MPQQSCRLAAFLIAVDGNWRNAIFIECSAIGCPHPCLTGVLFAAGPDGAPVLISAQELYRCTGQQADKLECLGCLDRSAFESAYRRFLTWRTETSNDCGLRQLLNAQSSLPCSVKTNNQS